jgi:hypothetical protein
VIEQADLVDATVQRIARLTCKTRIASVQSVCPPSLDPCMQNPDVVLTTGAIALRPPAVPAARAAES